MVKTRFFMGVDLSDPYAKTQKPNDLAFLWEEGDVTFEQFPWPDGWGRGAGDGALPPDLTEMIRGMMEMVGAMVIDGPQALAREGSTCRDAERLLRTPGRTPCIKPEPGSAPFAGYIRGSIEWFDMFTMAGVDGIRLADSGPAPWKLFEAYPGAAWPVLAGNSRLDSKGTRRGREQRASLLRACGLELEHKKCTHDQLDAALCALLGKWYLAPGGRVDLVGSPLVVGADGVRREGRILQPTLAVSGWSVLQKPARTAAVRTAKRGPGTLSRSWVYFATSARAALDRTYEFAAQDGLITRTVFADREPLIPIANVMHIQPGDTITLAYDDGRRRYRPIAQCRVTTPDKSVRHEGRTIPALMVVEERVAERLKASGYLEDPALHAVTAIPVDDVRDLRDETWAFLRPAGNNAIWREEDVDRVNGVPPRSSRE